MKTYYLKKNINRSIDGIRGVIPMFVKLFNILRQLLMYLKDKLWREKVVVLVCL